MIGIVTLFAKSVEAVILPTLTE